MVVVVLHCGSRSPTRTRCPSRASAAAMLTVVVVLPTPPFWLPRAKLLVMRAMLAYECPCVHPPSRTGVRVPARPPGRACLRTRSRMRIRAYARTRVNHSELLRGHQDRILQRRATVRPPTCRRRGGTAPSPDHHCGRATHPEPTGHHLRPASAPGSDRLGGGCRFR